VGRRTKAAAGPGRPRREGLDDAILAAAQRHLATHGYDAMSVGAVAEDAGTTRPALYRRWPTKADLATAAIAALPEAAARATTDDPFKDLVAELAAFQRGVGRPNGISMVGTMLQSGADRELRRLYRERVVLPRRRRLRAILERAREQGRLAPDADLDLGVATCTGSRYALELAGHTVGDWPRRTATFVWRALGGRDDQRSSR
jgi:AcrR family transcriptional regulator